MPQQQQQLQQHALHQQQQSQSLNNILPWPGSAAAHAPDANFAQQQDMRPILLFDLNGTLTQHTAARRSTGKSVLRPGTHHLLRLLVSLWEALPVHGLLCLCHCLTCVSKPFRSERLIGRDEQCFVLFLTLMT